jgi:hypothetical protein
MPTELDDTTAALIGRALLRWLIDEDPANVGRFVPDLDMSMLDDAKAARIGHTIVDLLSGFAVA